MAKNLLNKYVWLVETIYKAKRISFEDICQRWLDNDLSEGKPMSVRTFHKWRIAIEEMFGLIIENEHGGRYRYYIENEEEICQNGLRSWIYNSFCVGNALVNSQSIKDRILLEYVPSGQDHLQSIIEAMKENRILKMTYHSYWKEEESNFDVQPYCVKLYRQRWYMVARSTNPVNYKKGPRIYSLDRIKCLHLEEETFEMPKDWSANNYFDGCFGIIVEQDVVQETVKLKVSARQANYIRDLKMHKSQQEVERNEEYSIFEYFLRPTFDFQQEILWNGEEMEVLEPIWLRKVMTAVTKRMCDKYQSATGNTD